MPDPMVDIIVLAHDRADVTVECFRRLATMDHGHPVRINFLDNGSGAAVQKLAKWWTWNTRSWVPWARYRGVSFRAYRAKDNMGFSAGNNYVAGKCTAPWLLFLNNDAFPTQPLWLYEMIQTCADFGYDAMGPASNAVLGLQSAEHTGWSPVHDAKFLSGFCFLIRRDVFESIGGWDERFFNGDEDLDLSIRLRLAGHRIGVDRDVYVEHANQQTLGVVAAKQGITPQQWYARTRQQLINKHSDYIVRDLFVWEDLRLPRDKWRSIGVMPNGFYHQHPGTPADFATALGKLRSQSAHGRSRGGPDPLGELQARYTIGGTGDTFTLSTCGDTAGGTETGGGTAKTDWDRAEAVLAAQAWAG